MPILCVIFICGVMSVRFVMNIYRLFRVKPEYYGICLARLLCNGCEVLALGYIFRAFGG